MMILTAIVLRLSLIHIYAWHRRNSLRHFLGAQVGELAGLCRDALVYGSLVIAVTQGSLSIAQFTLMFGMTNGFITLRCV